MNCKRAEYLIAVLVSGTIEKADKAKLVGHIDACQCCRDVFEKQKTIEDALRNMRVASPDVNFARQTSKLASARMPRVPKPSLREILSWLTPYPVLNITFALAVAAIWIILDGAFIDWIRNMAIFAVESLSTHYGLVYMIGLIVAVLGLVYIGVSKMVREF